MASAREGARWLKPMPSTPFILPFGLHPCVSISGSTVGFSICNAVSAPLASPLYRSLPHFSLKGSLPHLPSHSRQQNGKGLFRLSSPLSWWSHTCYCRCLHFCLWPSWSHLQRSPGSIGGKRLFSMVEGESLSEQRLCTKGLSCYCFNPFFPMAPAECFVIWGWCLYQCGRVPGYSEETLEH